MWSPGGLGRFIPFLFHFQLLTSHIFFKMFPILIFVATLLFVFWVRSQKRPKNFPPGPWGFPLFGHFPQLGINASKTLSKWRKTYGPIIGIWFGSYRTVVLHDPKIIREAFNQIQFSSRPDLNILYAIGQGTKRGIVWSDGQLWKEERRFTLRHLRDFGFGKKSMEERIQFEVEELLNEFKKSIGKPLQVRNLFNTSVVNALWTILFSDRLDKNNAEHFQAIRRITSIAEDAGPFASLASLMPWLATLAPELTGYNYIVKEMCALNEFIQNQIHKHNENYLEGAPRDFVDVYTDEEVRKSTRNSNYDELYHRMAYTIADLFSAGAETTSTTLTWTCLYLIQYPEIQKKLQGEIDRVVGRERLPLLVDRPSMPFAEALMSEILRFSSIVPLAVFHSTNEDISFHGYHFPKDTMVIANTYSVHFDEELWVKPEMFRPERFLNKDGQFQKNENLLPFSTGKRVCLACHVGDTLPSLEPHIGFTLSPKPFEMILKDR